MNTLGLSQIRRETFPENAPLQCRYLRVEQALEYCPWKKSKLYELLRRGEIKSFLLKERGCTHGLRLIDKDSIDLFLERAAAAAEAEALREQGKTNVYDLAA
jgi:hypothetical protein